MRFYKEVVFADIYVLIYLCLPNELVTKSVAVILCYAGRSVYLEKEIYYGNM